MAAHWLQIDKENGRVLRETFAPLYEVVHQQWLRLITFNALPHSKGQGNWKVKNSLFSFWSVTYKYGGIDAKRLRSNNRNTWHQELWLWLDNYSTSAHLEMSGLHARRCFIKPYESEIRIRAFGTFIRKKLCDALTAQKATTALLVFPIHVKQATLIITWKAAAFQKHIVRSTTRTNQSSGMHHL